MGRTPKQVGIPYYDLVGVIEMPRKFKAFARRRIGGLTQFSECHRPLIDLLANAYVCGMKDTLEALEEGEE